MLRLVSDEDVPGDLLRGLRRREPQLDLMRVQDVGLSAAEDPVILEWAAAEGRVSVTRDRKTMIGHAYKRMNAGLAMTCLIVLGGRMTIGECIEQILIAAVCYSEEEMQDRVVFLPL